MASFDFAKRLLQWYDNQGRHDLPWRNDTTPYRVWISEIMLQQTQVATVIPYYHRFVQRFPNIKMLANASEDEVLILWTGLGYYSRARNLHRAAKIIVNDYQEQFPNSVEELAKLPGIGRSTAGAILAISMEVIAPILDGNVKRVLARFFAIKHWPGEKNATQQLWHYAETLLPQKRINDYTQAIMDLGATICTRSQPKCLLCPVQENCMAKIAGLSNELPISKPTKAIPTREKFLLILRDKNDAMLLIKRPPTGIWASLWSFPECESQEELEFFCEKMNCSIMEIDRLEPFTHVFSHFKLIAKPIVIRVQRKLKVQDATNQKWIIDDRTIAGGLPAPIKKLLSQLFCGGTIS